MGCEPRGFGWSATVEVCSARVTRLVTDLKNHEKFSTRQLVPGTLERPRAGMLANPSMRLVPGTLVSPSVGMLAKELGVWWEKLANFGFREAFGRPGSSCGLSDHKSQNFFDFPGFVEVPVLD